jgi:hypothetical protein
MRRLIGLGLLLLAVGCQGIDGPFAHKMKPEKVDDPRLSIPEQERRGRDRLAIPETDPNFVPRTYGEYPAAPHSR